MLDGWRPQNLQAYDVKIQQTGLEHFMDTEFSVCKVKTLCRDKFAAAHEARSLVKEATGLFQLGNVSAEKTVLPGSLWLMGKIVQ